MADDIKKKEADAKEITLSPDIPKYLNEWTKNPQSKVFVKLAEEYRKSGLLDEALHVCEKGLTSSPNYLSANMVLAKIYFDMGEFDKSLAEALKVTAAQSDNLMAQNLLLDLYIEKGDKENAIGICDVISYLDPKNENIVAKKEELMTVGIVKPAVKTKEESEEDVKAAVKEEFDMPREAPDEEEEEEPAVISNGFVTNTVAELYIKQGYYEKGLNIYQELLSESPDEPKLIEKIKELEEMVANKEAEAPSEQEEVPDLTLVEPEEKKEVPEYELDLSDVPDIDTEELGVEMTPIKAESDTKEKEEAGAVKVLSADNEKKISRLENWLGKIQSRGGR